MNVREAADYAGVSQSTIRRKKPELIRAGARIEARTWQIPEAALHIVFGQPEQSPEQSVDSQRLLDELSFLRDLVKQQQATISRQAEALQEQQQLAAQLEAMRQQINLKRLEQSAPQPASTPTPNQSQRTKWAFWR